MSAAARAHPPPPPRPCLPSPDALSALPRVALRACVCAIGDSALLQEWLTITGVATLPMEQLQNLIFQEMLYFHPEAMGLPWGAVNPDAM